MNPLIAAAALALLGAAPPHGAEPVRPAAEAPFPLQLEARVEAPPVPFVAAGRTHLLYELHLTNREPAPLTLERIEVLDGAATAQVVQGAALDPLLQSPGRALAPRAAAVVFMALDIEAGRGAPTRLRHRITTSAGVLEGAETLVARAPRMTLGPPVQGGLWLAGDGPGNGADNHHRRGLVVIDGRAVISRRFAIDWQKVEGGKVFAGDEHDVRAYFGYGAPVLAVADATVSAARDGMPDNRPGHGRDFHPAVPVTLDSTPGNTVVLALGDGRFAHYFHLQPGSVQVKPGQRVRRGQVIGRIGSSGDAREPHLHLEVTDSPKAMAGEGLPYAIDRYRIVPADGGPERTTHNAIPLDREVVAFGR